MTHSFVRLFVLFCFFFFAVSVTLERTERDCFPFLFSPVSTKAVTGGSGGVRTRPRLSLS